MTRVTDISIHVIVGGDMQKINNSQRELNYSFCVTLQKELDTRLIKNGKKIK